MKKFMSLLLSVLLLLSLVPMAVSADEVTETWNALTYYMDGPEFSLEATEFEGSGSYKFYAAAYDAEGRLRAVKSAAAAMDGTSLKASVNFEPGANDEAPTDIDMVKTMLWKGLTPVAEAGEFDDAITPMTYDAATDTYSSITNGFYRRLAESTDTFDLRTSIIYAYAPAGGSLTWTKATFSETVHNNNKLSDSVNVGWSGSVDDDANAFYLTALPAEARVDKVVAYVHNTQRRSHDAEFYMVTNAGRPYNSGTQTAEQLQASWANFDSDNTNAAANGVYYLGKMAEGHRPVTMNDAGAKQVFNIPETAGNFRAFVAKVTYGESDLRMSEMHLYEKVTDSISFVTERPEYNVAQNAAAFAYGEADGSEAYLAVDGRTNTAWTSLNNTALNDYLVLDLGTAYSVSSIKATVPSGVGQNFTVYGANDAKQTDKTALTGVITGLSEGVESDLGTIKSPSAFRYIIFEQAASETSFGFSEIKVNSTQSKAANHTAVGPVAMTPFTSCAFAGGPSGNSNTTNGAKVVDGDPTTEHHDTWNPTLFLYDLGAGNAQKLTHVAYQENHTNGLTYATDFQIVATNNTSPRTAFTTGDYVVLAESSGRPTFSGTGTALDSGLLIYEVAEAYKDTAYRFVGLYKASGALGASTLQAYTKHTLEYNVAENAAAFAYGEAEGSEAYLAVDGSASTAWTSLNNTALNDYLVLDLGAAYSVSSIKATVPSGVGQNFTVYGANDAKQTDKTALTGVITGLGAGVEADLGAIQSTSAFRYIIFEQAASETSFGFSEIKVNSKDAAAANHTAIGPVELVSAGATCVAAGLPGSTGLSTTRASASKFVDADPTTKIYDVWDDVFFIFDLTEEKTLTHVAYQFVGSTGTEKLCGQDFKLIATNASDYQKITDANGDPNYVVLAEMAGAPTYNATDDTGLLVFEVAESYRNAGFRYFGILKANAAGSERVGASTLQAYAKIAE